jgi:hypothetical protein
MLNAIILYIFLINSNTPHRNIIYCNSQEALKQKKNQEKMGESCEMSEPKQSNKIRIYINKADHFDLNKDEIRTAIIKKNDVNNGITNFKFCIEHISENTDRNRIFIILNCGPVTKQYLLDYRNGQIAVGLGQYYLWKQIDMKMYYKCNGYGHTSRVCKSESSCKVCAGAHNVKVCTSQENPQGTNCMKRNKKYGLDLDVNHKARDFTICPTHNRIIQWLNVY